MNIPIIRKSSEPTLQDNPKFNKCLWLNTSVTPAKLFSYNEELKGWESISEVGGKNLNAEDTNENYRIWVGNKQQFEKLDVLEDNVVYSVKGLGEFIGNHPMFSLVPQVKFVNKDYQGKRTLGCSWEFPFNNIQDAIDNANEGDRIWITSGTYVYENPNNSASSYIVTKRIELYGGFNGTELSIEERSLSSKTVLDGKNSRRLFSFSNKSNGSLVDGFSFINGNAGSDNGGAIHSTGNITVRYCEFKNNTAALGGALYNVTNIFNSVFDKNTANNNGNSVFLTKNGIINSCTIVRGIGNNAISSDSNVTLQLYNTVIWNSISGGDSVQCSSNSMILNCASTSSLSTFSDSNIRLSYEDNKIFTNISNGDFSIEKNSPLVNAGTKILYNTELDFIGNERVSRGSIDIGAYEYQDSDIVYSVCGQIGDVNLSVKDIEGLTDELSTLDDRVDEILDLRNAPNGLATLDENGKVLPDQLPGQISEVLEGYLVSSDVFNDKNGNPYDNLSDKLYIDITEGQNLIYRWDNSKFISLGTRMNLGTNEGEAYPGIKGIELENLIKEQASKLADVNGLKISLGIDKVDNTPDVAKPISEVAERRFNSIEDSIAIKKDELIDGKIPNSYLPDSILGALTFQGTWRPDLNEPDLGLPTAWNRGDYYIAVTNGIKYGFDFEPGDWIIYSSKTPESGISGWKKVDNVDSVVTVNGKKGNVTIEIDDIPGLRDTLDQSLDNEALVSHISDINNPHKLTSSQLGLGNVDNTSDQDKPVSIIQKEYIDSTANELKISIVENTKSISHHKLDTNNPHGVTAEQIGLGKVDNTSDLEKPVSIAQKDYIDNNDNLIREALNNKASLSGGKLIDSQIPDNLKNCVKFQGVWDANSNSPALLNDSPLDEGKYYIVREPGVWHSIKFYSDDFIVNAGGTWYKICGQRCYEELEERVKKLEELVNKLIEDPDQPDTPDDPEEPEVTLSITSFKSNIDTENAIGQSITPTLSWSLNVDEVDKITINGVEISANLRSYNPGVISSNTTYKLVVTKGNQQVEKTLSFKFYPVILYGINSEASYDESLISEFNNLLVKSSLNTNITFGSTASFSYPQLLIPTDLQSKVTLMDMNGFELTMDTEDVIYNGVNYVLNTCPNTVRVPMDLKLIIKL